MSEIHREMKRRIRFTSPTRWSETEMDVAETLRDLYRISLLSSVPFTWRCNGKRSSIQNNTSPSPNKRLCTFYGILKGGGASNPAILVSFPATEPDEKTKHAKNNISLAKKQELLLKTIDDMKKSQAALNQLNKEEIENLKKQFDCDQLRNLKIRKQEFHYSNLKIGEKVQLDDQVVNNSKSTAENREQKKEQNQFQQIQLQMVPIHQNQTNGFSSIGLGRNINNNINGPIALPDLNLLIGKITANRANRVNTATYARKRRLQIIRVKKNRK